MAEVRRSAMLAVLMAGFVSQSAFANEITGYGYDVHGRLIGVGRTNGPLDGLRDEVPLDPGDNRSRFIAFNVVFTLPSGQSFWSPDGRTQLAMQGDGNLVIYFQGTPLWSTKTNGKSVAKAQFQSDGNLVLYDANGGAVWQAGTGGNYGAKLALQNDGNLVIYNLSTVAIWNSGTGGH